MATLETLGQELKFRLETIPGLHVYDYWPDSFVTPAAIINFPTQASLTFATYVTTTVEIIVLASILKDRIGQKKLRLYLDKTGTESLQVALEGDLDLRDNVDTIIWQGWRDQRPMRLNEGSEWYYGAVIDLEVIH